MDFLKEMYVNLQLQCQVCPKPDSFALILIILIHIFDCLLQNAAMSYKNFNGQKGKLHIMVYGAKFTGSR